MAGEDRSSSQLSNGQVKLQAQQAALKARLQQALQMPTLPKTNVDTVTVADKALPILDTIIEVCLLRLWCVLPLLLFSPQV